MDSGSLYLIRDGQETATTDRVGGREAVGGE